MYVLLRKHNEYNQYGSYFVAAWPSKPSVEEIHALMCRRYPLTQAKAARHVWEGGGRVNCDDVWFLLRKIDPGLEF